MTAENACPHCGNALPAEVPQDAAPAAAPVAADPHAEATAPPISLLGPGSNDENFVAAPFGRRAASPEPDPILGAYVAGPGTGPEPPAARPGSTPAFPEIDFTSSPSKAPPRSEDDFDDSPEPPEGGRSWATLLLASYASAVTLGLAWILYQKPRDRPIAPPNLPAVAPSSAGHQAALSRTVTPPEPILAEHRVGLKSPLVIGSLEVTPLEVRREGVTLQRTNLAGMTERREGGKSALVLRLKLRNIARDEVFAPLDQSYIRKRDEEVVDTFIETASGERIYPFPLAVESEWSIPGQDFEELRPGESRDVAIVSVPAVPTDLGGPITWRVRLRTGIGRTDVIGVRWPDPPGEPPKG